MKKSGAKILIVDDRKENLFSLKSLLADLEVDIQVASSGSDALSLMIDHDFAVALLDVQMPEMDGFELAELMRGAEKTKNIPIIFITAATESSGFVFKGYESGAVDFMYKPINPTILKSKIKIFIELEDQRQLLHTKMEELVIAKDAAEKANRLKSAFLANMSHEIRTPLNAVIGFADLMRADTLTDKERLDYADIISRSGHTLVSIIDDILDLSKVESGYLEFESVRYSPADVVKEVMNLLSVKANKKNIGLSLEIDDKVPKVSISDVHRFKQILMNLIGNAIKFTDRGGVSVSLDYSRDTEQITVLVSDTGIGIAQENREKIFQPFMQADNSVTRKFGGTGLGLVLAKRLAQLLGGDVELLNSELRRGSTFLVKIKHELSGSNVKKPASAHADIKPLEEKNLNGLKVLLVEDSQDNQILLELFLSKKGIDLEMASNGEEGVKKALSGNHHIVLMDIQMPVMDGYQATKQLRDKKFEKPIIALTAHAMVSEQERCIREGFTDFLSKPLDRRELFKKLSSYYS